MDPNTIKDIKSQMGWYGFTLTDQQVLDYLKENPEAEEFDTVEREGFSNYLAKKITGMEWPMYGSPDDYKKEFYSKMKENAKDKGYIWRPDE